MKHTVILSLIVLFACQPQQQKEQRATAEIPHATVSPGPNNERELKGPLAYGATVPETAPGDTIEVKIDVHHKLFHIRPDIAYTAWTFGDSTPGPVLKVRVGQTVKFSMTDRSDEQMKGMTMQMNMQPMHAMPPMQHSIDFHAAMVNPEDKYRSIQPGETIHFTWTAHYPGVFMYHCGTPMVLMHMIYGMVGMVIVEPRGGYPKVDREFAIVQNEYYLKKSGDIYVPDTNSARMKQPTFVTFNGKLAQYVIHPLKAKAGERVRFYVLNAGPNNATNFHIIGTIMDKVWLDGNPKNELEGMQSVYLGPSSGAIVEFTLPEKGRYTFVDHSFADAEMGAMGAIVAE